MTNYSAGLDDQGALSTGSLFCHRHLKIVTNFESSASSCHQHQVKPLKSIYKRFWQNPFCSNDKAEKSTNADVCHFKLLDKSTLKTPFRRLGISTTRQKKSTFWISTLKLSILQCQLSVWNLQTFVINPKLG